MSDERRKVEAEEIKPLLEELNDFVQRAAEKFGPVEIECALCNTLLNVYNVSNAPTKMVILSNLADFMDLLAMASTEFDGRKH